MRVKKGERIGAIRGQEADGKLYVYGFGVYEGDEFPPTGTPGPFGVDLSDVAMPNPKFRLDDGQILWGGQCWWGEENAIQNIILKFKGEVIKVPSPNISALSKDEDRMDPSIQTWECSCCGALHALHHAALIDADSGKLYCLSCEETLKSGGG